MRNILLFGLFLLIFHGANAQITISNSTFPAVGDTLRTVFDGMPGILDINPDSGVLDANWNFSGLQGVLRETIYRDADTGTNADEFPTAEMVTNFGAAGENYYRVTGNTFELLGYQGPDPAGLGFNLAVHASPPIVERRAPLNLDDNYTEDGSILVPVAFDDIPGGIVDSLPITPDSVRLKIENIRTNEVDGWGSLQIPGGTYEVLREKRIEFIDTRIEVKIGALPWIDLTDELDFDFLGEDTITTYNFYNNNSKEVIAIVTVDNIDNDQLLFVDYKYNDATTNVRYVNNGKPALLAYPNPAIEDIRLEFMNLPGGDYTVKIYNILGVEVWNKSYSIHGDHMEKVDISEFRKGTYLYSLVNENGKTISTKRLVVMRP